MSSVEIKVTYHFYMHHNPTKTLIEKLNWTQMNSICRTLRTADWAHYQVWVAELDVWIKLTDLIGEILNRSDGFFRAPPNPPERINGELLDHQLVEAPMNNREHTRYNYKLPMTLDITGSLVNTYTQDISLGGVRLENPVPTRKKLTHCFLYFRSGEELIEFKVKPFYDSEGVNSFVRVQFESCNNLHMWKNLLIEAARKGSS